MSDDQRKDSTKQLIAEGEALRGQPGKKKAPGTRTLVREAERLIGRGGAAPGVKGLLVAAVALALVALAVAAMFLLFA